jgi:hypothetical protein
VIMRNKRHLLYYAVLSLAAFLAYSYIVFGVDIGAVRLQETGRVLIEAAKDGDREIVAALIENGADVNAADEDGMTVLAWAVQLDDGEMAQFLIGKGADLEGGAEAFKAPLHVAANWGKREMAELLLSKGADIEVRDRNGWTPLHWAAFEGGWEMVMLLVSKGAEKNARTEKKWSIFERGATALDIAEKAGDRAVIDLLKKLGCRSGKELAQARIYAGFAFDTEPGDEGWSVYTNTIELRKDEIDKSGADAFPLSQEIPEAVVIYFYARLMKGDAAACRKVLYPGSETEEELGELEKWPLQKVRLLKKNKYSSSRVWISLYFRLESEGKIDEGEDEIDLVFAGNKWWITNLPL